MRRRARRRGWLRRSGRFYRRAWSSGRGGKRWRKKKQRRKKKRRKKRERRQRFGGGAPRCPALLVVGRAQRVASPPTGSSPARLGAESPRGVGERERLAAADSEAERRQRKKRKKGRNSKLQRQKKRVGPAAAQEGKELAAGWAVGRERHRSKTQATDAPASMAARVPAVLLVLLASAERGTAPAFLHARAVRADGGQLPAPASTRHLADGALLARGRRLLLALLFFAVRVVLVVLAVFVVVSLAFLLLLLAAGAALLLLWRGGGGGGGCGGERQAIEQLRHGVVQLVDEGAQMGLLGLIAQLAEALANSAAAAENGIRRRRRHCGQRAGRARAGVSSE